MKGKINDWFILPWNVFNYYRFIYGLLYRISKMMWLIILMVIVAYLIAEREKILIQGKLVWEKIKFYVSQIKERK